MVKSPPAVQKTWVQSLGREDPLAGKMATQSSILAWRIPWTEEPGELKSMGPQRVRRHRATKHAHMTGHLTSHLQSRVPTAGPLAPAGGAFCIQL